VYVNNPDVVTIDNEKSATIPFEEINNILKDVKYIPLVSKEPIGEFHKILIYKERIYVLDAFIAEKIFIFNMKGEIIKIIDSKGGGPKEYRGLMDMTISPKDDYLVVADRLAPFVFYFSLNGEFVKKTRGIINTTVEIMDDKSLNQLNPGQSFDDDVNYHLIVSIGDKVIRKGFPFYPFQLDAIFEPPFRYNYKNELLFCPYYCDTVYRIANDSVYTVKYIVKHSKSVWKKYNQRMSVDKYDRLIADEGYTALSKPILETENFVCYSIKAKMKLQNKYYIQSRPYWFNKNTGTSFTIGRPVESRDIYNVIFKPESMYGNHYVGIIPSVMFETIKYDLKEGKHIVNYQNKEFQDMMMDKNPNLEAILVLFEFKNSE
jgi:hypothetical protein